MTQWQPQLAPPSRPQRCAAAREGGHQLGCPPNAQGWHLKILFTCIAAAIHLSGASSRMAEPSAQGPEQPPQRCHKFSFLSRGRGNDAFGASPWRSCAPSGHLTSCSTVDPQLPSMQSSSPQTAAAAGSIQHRRRCAGFTSRTQRHSPEVCSTSRAKQQGREGRRRHTFTSWVG